MTVDLSCLRDVILARLEELKTERNRVYECLRSHKSDVFRFTNEAERIDCQIAGLKSLLTDQELQF